MPVRNLVPPQPRLIWAPGGSVGHQRTGSIFDLMLVQILGPYGDRTLLKSGRPHSSSKLRLLFTYAHLWPRRCGIRERNRIRGVAIESVLVGKIEVVSMKGVLSQEIYFQKSHHMNALHGIQGPRSSAVSVSKQADSAEHRASAARVSVKLLINSRSSPKFQSVLSSK